MNYEIITSRWHCPECNGRVRLYFQKSGSTEEEPSEEFTCDKVLCEDGHVIPEVDAQEMIELADEEFYGAMERGWKAAEIWVNPDPDQGMLPFESPADPST